MKTFNITTDTTPTAEFDFPTPTQALRAKGCERVFRFRNIYRVEALPNYIRTAIFNGGYEAEIVGSSSFKYTLIGLTKIG